VERKKKEKEQKFESESRGCSFGEEEDFGGGLKIDDLL